MEEIKDVPGWEGVYAVSRNGRIWSYPNRLHDGKWLLTRLGKNSLCCSIDLCSRGKKRKTINVHRLVAKAFIPNPDNLPEVNHKDGNRENNVVSNLEWCTSSQNQKHAYATGLQIHKKGEDWHPAKLTEENVKYIRTNYNKQTCNYTDLGREFDVAAATVRDVVLRKTWRHI